MLNLDLIQHCANILGEILDFHGPADMKLSNYYREHGELGQKDRGEIAECIYGVIRRLRFLKKINEIIKYQSKDKLNEVYGFVSEFINNQVRVKSTDKIYLISIEQIINIS